MQGGFFVSAWPNFVAGEPSSPASCLNMLLTPGPRVLMNQRSTSRHGAPGNTRAVGDLAVRALVSAELPAAVVLLAQAMLDNPLHVAAFGEDEGRRLRRLRGFLVPMLAYVESHGTVLGAFSGSTLIGAMGMIAPGQCRPAWRQRWRIGLGIVRRNSPLGVLRIHRWLSSWLRLDPAEPHWHLGPLAVMPNWRRKGVGRALMNRCCQRLDREGASAWLETDLAINVEFYRSLGFTVAHKQQVLGVTNWFMRRDPQRSGG